MTDRESRLSIETLTAQGLGWVDDGTRSIAPPIYPSATFQRNADLSYENNRVYTRADNPTYDQVSELLATLECGSEAQLFSSGMAAIVSVFQALKPGDHVIAPESVYIGVRKWLTHFAGPWGLEYDFIPNDDAAALQQAAKPGKTKIVWVETPSNPLWKITDIKNFAAKAHEFGAMVVVDNTVATPVLTRPLELGADMVMHSCTKYMNGHGDILMGALITKEKNELWRRVREIAHDAGSLPGSFEAWLLLRGARTLFLRMERICSNAMLIAEHLKTHPEVKEVLYPGLKENQGHEVAKRQMKGGFGGMLSFRLKGGREAAVKVHGSTKVFKRATSLGTVESLIEHRASYEGPETTVPDDLIRISVGIESGADLIDDLEQALSAV